MKAAFLLFLMLNVSLLIKSQDFSAGGGFSWYTQNLYRETVNTSTDPHNRYSSGLDNTRLNTYGFNVSGEAQVKYFVAGISYVESRVYMHFNGFANSSYGGLGGGGSNESTYNYDGFFHRRSVFISAGGVILPNKKINIIPMIGLGLEGNAGQKAKVDYAVTEGYQWQMGTGGSPPISDSWREEYKVSDIMFKATSPVVVRIANLKLRYRFNNRFSVDLQSGIKFRHQPLFGIANYKENREWFSGLMFNYAFNTHRLEKE